MNFFTICFLLQIIVYLPRKHRHYSSIDLLGIFEEVSLHLLRLLLRVKSQRHIERIPTTLTDTTSDAKFLTVGLVHV